MEIGNALKESLIIGSKSATKELGAENGYYNDKITLVQNRFLLGQHNRFWIAKFYCNKTVKHSKGLNIGFLKTFAGYN